MIAPSFPVALGGAIGAALALSHQRGGLMRLFGHTGLSARRHLTVNVVGSFA
jgi:hypothetical protein